MYQDFYCACPEGYAGKTCGRLKEDCRARPCQGDDVIRSLAAGARHLNGPSVSPRSNRQLHRRRGDRRLRRGAQRLLQRLRAAGTLRQRAGGQLQLRLPTRLRRRLLSRECVGNSSRPRPSLSVRLIASFCLFRHERLRRRPLQKRGHLHRRRQLVRVHVPRRLGGQDLRRR